MRLPRYHVYLLRCADSSYYVGVTNDLDRRFAEHRTGLYSGSYPFSRRPLELVYCALFPDVGQAIRFEKQVKGWSSKEKGNAHSRRFSGTAQSGEVSE